MNHFDGEHHEFLGQNSKGYLISVIFNPMGPLVIFPQNSRLSQAKWCIVFNSKRSEAKLTPSEIELIARRKSKK